VKAYHVLSAVARWVSSPANHLTNS